MSAIPDLRTETASAATSGARTGRDRWVLRIANLLLYLRHPRTVVQFRLRVGFFPNIARPRRFAELMLWRKCFDRNPRFVTFTDKLATKALAARLCPDLAQAEVLWAGDDVRQIPPAVLARPVVIKASHGCDFSHVRPRGARDRALRPRQIRRINGWLRRRYGQHLLEWAYRLAGRKLFAEAMILPPPGEELLDLSVHAADGVPLIIEAVVANKTARQRKGYFHPDGARWPELEPRRRVAVAKRTLPADFQLPMAYRAASTYAGRLGAGIDYARFDFLVAGEQLYAGEISVYPGSGLARHDEFLAYNTFLAARWSLLSSWFFQRPHRGLRGVYAAALANAFRARNAEG